MRRHRRLRSTAPRHRPHAGGVRRRTRRSLGYLRSPATATLRPFAMNPLPRGLTLGLMIEVTLLGTGSPMVDPRRAGPSTLVRAGGQTFLVDCGRGVLMRAAAVGVGAANISAVLLTHLHSDHITDLSDVITTRWVMSFTPAPLIVVGPVGTRQLVDDLLAALAPDISYRIAHHADLERPPQIDVIEVTDGAVDLPGRVSVRCAP